MKEPVLVAGATGGVGRQVVARLVARHVAVRALVREVGAARTLLGPGVKIVQGDVREPSTLTPAMHGVHAVISAIGSRAASGGGSPERIDYEGVRNLVEAARAAGVEHFVLVSSIGVTRPDHPLNAYGRVLEWKLKGEDALRGQGAMAYTIVRPGGLRDEPGGQTALQFDQGDRISGLISRVDVAEVCIQALEQPAARDMTFEVIGVEGPPPRDWAALFGALRHD